MRALLALSHRNDLSSLITIHPLPKMSDPKRTEFEKAAAEQGKGGILREVWGFMKQNKKWWLLPLILALLVFGLLVVLSGTGLAPFIYTLF
jgi:hypothetical protein